MVRLAGVVARQNLRSTRRPVTRPAELRQFELHTLTALRRQQRRTGKVGIGYYFTIINFHSKLCGRVQRLDGHGSAEDRTVMAIIVIKTNRVVTRAQWSRAT